MHDDERTPVSQDREWAEAVVKHGDELAFRRLYRRHTPRLYQFVLRILGGAEMDAEDVVQETWLRAVTHLEGFRWQSAFPTWLTGIGLNLCRERFRQRRKGRRTGLEAVPDLRAAHSHPGIAIDLEQAIALLPDGYRTVLVLHDVQGLTQLQISQRLEISAGTSKSQLFNARKLILALLAGNRSDKESSHEPSRRRRVE